MHSDDRDPQTDALAQLVDRELKRLTPPIAPHTLLARVMAATVHARRVPWYRRAWTTWPVAWQTVSALASLFVVIAVVWFWPVIAGASAAWALSLMGAGHRVMAAVDTLDVVHQGRLVMSATRIVWTSVMAPWIGYLAVLVAVMGAACATVGAAISRVALGGASRA